MRLALQTDYSLRTLMYLATRSERQTVQNVASFFQISETHIGKVVHQLARMGYVRSVRGVGGGLELAKSPDEISIGEIIRAVEGNLHLLECIGLENVCVIQQHCKLRTVLNHAERIQLDYLNSVRLSDVLPFGTPALNIAGTSMRPRVSTVKLKKTRSQVGERKKDRNVDSR
jgi:Rrf2 family nitric oxide-sensitive transcriptional repressor